MKKKILLLGGNGLVGKAVAEALGNDYQIVPTAGHHDPENGDRLTVEEPNKLVEILIREEPDIVISSIRGNFQAQINFHRTLANWLVEKKKQLLYMSTANVFDGNSSQPWTEDDPPMPESDYGIFKRDCEAMLRQLLGSQLIIFRLAAVWSFDCPRIQQLKLHSQNKEPHYTYPNYMINVTPAKQIGEYAKYVLDHNLHGIFHVGTTDMVDYSSCEKMVCQALDIKFPHFVTEDATAEKVFFAVLPSRKEIPANLQMTVSNVLSTLK